jgi:FkbM family methyltransferase
MIDGRGATRAEGDGFETGDGTGAGRRLGPPSFSASVASRILAPLRRRVGALIRAAGYMVIPPTQHRAYPLARFIADHRIDLVLDVGAHRGEYVRLLRYLGYEGDVISFEPQAAAYAAVDAASRRDDRWNAHNLALGDEDGEAILNIAYPSSRSSLLAPGAGDAARGHVSFVATERVATKRLDDVVDESLLSARNVLLKLDVQGFEWQVLQGGARTLQRVAGVQIEMGLVERYDGERLFPEIVARLEEMGFLLARVIPGVGTANDGRLLHLDGIFVRARAAGHTRDHLPTPSPEPDG